jgi:nucleoid DNA-binding protein
MARIPKSALIEGVALAQDLPQSTVRRVLESVLEQIAGCVSDGDEVQMPGFGTFLPRDRAARPGRNIRTGEPITLPASRTMAFKASKAGK